MRLSETRVLSVGRTVKFFSPGQEPAYWETKSRSYLIAKRAFDIFLSLLVCVTLLWWLLPLVALLIKLESRGPVFFVQNRVGLRGQIFGCIKLRSMVVNKDADKKQACNNDPRITPFGKFLRISCIDELPQFFNVLMGQMTIVGPRPHMLSDCESFASQIENYDLRHSMRPGITGMAQVKGYRGKTTGFLDVFHRYQMDAFYVRNANFLLDLRIVFQTFIQTIQAIVRVIKKKEQKIVKDLSSVPTIAPVSRTAFSVVIVVNDSGRKLPALLKSLHGLTDDIIVCDTGNHDSTIDLAKTPGARLIHLEWEGYGRTKNLAAAQAKYDWVLSLEPDERVDQQLHSFLRSWSPANTHEVYQVLWKNFIGNEWIRYSDWSRKWKNRLYNKQVATWEDTLAHEDITSSVQLNYVKVNGYLEHYSFGSKDEFVTKVKRSAMLAAMKYHLGYKRSTWAHVAISPVVSFLNNYIFKLGFLDGKKGWLVATTSANYAFRKYWALWKLNHNKFQQQELEIFFPKAMFPRFHLQFQM
jgi:putative colanic acid biosysnthesis UDP-glucose lipid carrier transferase